MDVIDDQKIKMLRELGEKLKRENYFTHLVDTFHKDGRKIIQQVNEGMEQNNLDTVTQSLHRLKGSCGFFGAVGLQNYCAQLEEQLLGKELALGSDELQGQLQVLETGFENCVKLLIESN